MQQAAEARNLGLPVSGSIVLNELGGGINWRSVEQALLFMPDDRLRLIAHFPTITGRKHNSILKRTSNPNLRQIASPRPLTLTGESGELLPCVIDVIKHARDSPVILSTGHASKEEVYRVIDAALAFGLDRLLINQPANPLTGFSAQELRAISEIDLVYVEQCALTVWLGYQTLDDFQSALRSIPRLIYSSDAGQPSQRDIPEWLAWSHQMFGDAGLSPHRVEEITKNNPLKLLSL
ncbi:hypothetical protein JUN65_04235 [Gluconacetobacter azotocaptans]|nr:hypothetical protein [Gluconacetobacter azotocaptans]